MDVVKFFCVVKLLTRSISVITQDVAGVKFGGQQWRLAVEFAGGAASHILIFFQSLSVVYLSLFSY